MAPLPAPSITAPAQNTGSATIIIPVIIIVIVIIIIINSDYSRHVSGRNSVQRDFRVPPDCPVHVLLSLMVNINQ